MYDLLTPERVSVRYDIAGAGSRGGAVAIDLAIQVGLQALVLLAVALAAAWGGLSLEFGEGLSLGMSVLLAVLAVSLLLIWVGYYAFFEIVWSGQTPGKRAFGLRVIRENGYPVRAVDAVVRNLVRIVDFLPSAYALGLLVMLLNGRARRLGDFAAGTLVVREGAHRAAPLAAAGSPAALAAADAAHAVPSPTPAVLSADEATLVRDYLLRRAQMRPAARAALAGRLAGTLAARHDLAATRAADGSDELFLERLASG